MLNKDIYEKKYVDQGCQAFSELATINIEETDDHFSCCLTDCKYEERRTAMELENFNIDSMNVKTS